MKQAEIYLRKAFVVSSVYLLTIILGGFFILPGIFQVNDYDIPLVIELFLKVTSIIATLIVLPSAIIIPWLNLSKKPKPQAKSPVVIASATLLVGIIFIFLHALYVKLRTCPPSDNSAWYCHVDGKDYPGMLFIMFFLASLVGCTVWVVQKLTKKK